MKIQLNQVFKDKNGKPVKDGEADLTLENVAYTALILVSEQEANLPRTDRLLRGRLAQRIAASTGEVDLKSEEVTLIKECIGKSYGPWVVVQAEDMLEKA